VNDISDEQLIKNLSANPELGFRQLYDRYSGPLMRFLYRFTASQQVAEEILHDLFTEILKGSFEDRGQESLKNWLFTVAKNKGLNHKRRDRRQVLSEETVERAASEENLEMNFSQSQLLQQLAKHEAQLPPDLAATWKLRREGLDYEEIAAKLSIPLGTVKSRFHRLVLHLKEEFLK
jgi:RNA polymerase sigma-70 factor (ECF subfamily)